MEEITPEQAEKIGQVLQRGFPAGARFRCVMCGASELQPVGFSNVPVSNQPGPGRAGFTAQVLMMACAQCHFVYTYGIQPGDFDEF